MSSLFAYNRSTFKLTQSTLLGARLHPFCSSLQQPFSAKSVFVGLDQERDQFQEKRQCHSLELQAEEGAFCQSIFAREDDEVRDYTAFKRFRPGGPHPPAPPVGGQFFSKDALADSIINKSSLQT